MPKDKFLISAELEAIILRKEAFQSEVIKLVWIYLKENDLQCKEDKKYFVPDKKIAKVFGKEKFRGGTIVKHIEAHMSKITVTNDSDDTTRNKKQEDLKYPDDAAR